MYTDKDLTKASDNVNNIKEYKENFFSGEKSELESRTGFSKLDMENVLDGLYLEKYRNKFMGLENVDRMYLLREMCIRVNKETQKETQKDIDEYRKIAIKIENIFFMCSCVESIYFWNRVFEDINRNITILRVLCYTESEKYIELCDNQQSNYKKVETRFQI